MSCCQALKAEFVRDRLVYKHEARAWSQAHTRSWLITDAKSYLLVGASDGVRPLHTEVNSPVCTTAYHTHTH
jgi:hypothetical protein